MSKIINGVNVTELFQTIDAVKANPAVAKFSFRLNNKWLKGSRNRSTVSEYRGAEQDLQRLQPFVLDADEPSILLGSDKAPNPAEYLLQALAACVTTSIVYQAAAKGITIDEIESRFEGDVDLRGFLGLGGARNGFENIRMTVAVRADISDEELQDVVKLGGQFSPVYDSVANGVPITVQAKRLVLNQLSDAA